MFTVEHVGFKLERVDTLDTGKIGAKMIGLSGGYMEGIDTAVLAEIVFGRFLSILRMMLHLESLLLQE